MPYAGSIGGTAPGTAPQYGGRSLQAFQQAVLTLDALPEHALHAQTGRQRGGRAAPNLVEFPLGAAQLRLLFGRGAENRRFDNTTAFFFKGLRILPCQCGPGIEIERR